MRQNAAIIRGEEPSLSTEEIVAVVRESGPEALGNTAGTARVRAWNSSTGTRRQKSRRKKTWPE